MNELFKDLIMAKIGFIGLGHMGLPMAINLIKAGHLVTGFDLKTESQTKFEEAGGNKANNLKEAAQEQDIILTMLQTGHQVKQACLGEDGIFKHAAKNSFYIDCSSIDVSTSQLLHKEGQKSLLHVLDSPVSGGVAGAQNGTLTFMVGGDEQILNQLKPIFNIMGKNIIHTGGPGNGQAAKICNNMILGISMIAISEAFVLAEKLGLSPLKLHEVVTNSSGQCWAMDKYVPVPDLLPNVPANNNYQPGFSAAMMLKDLILSQDSAEFVKLQTPLASLATQLYGKFNEDGHGELDFSAIIKTLS